MKDWRKGVQFIGMPSDSIQIPHVCMSSAKWNCPAYRSFHSSKRATSRRYIRLMIVTTEYPSWYLPYKIQCQTSYNKTMVTKCTRRESKNALFVSTQPKNVIKISLIQNIPFYWKEIYEISISVDFALLRIPSDIVFQCEILLHLGWSV